MSKHGSMNEGNLVSFPAEIGGNLTDLGWSKYVWEMREDYNPATAGSARLYVSAFTGAA